MIIQYMYPSGAHLCSWSRNNGYGTHTAPNVWTDVMPGDCTDYVDDLVGALDETGYAAARSRADQPTPYDNGQFEWNATAPPQGCTISQIQLWAYARVSNGNAQSIDEPPVITGFVRENTSSTRNYSGTNQTITNGKVTVGTFRNRVSADGTFTKYDLGIWETCPWTSSAWTQGDLAAGTFTFGIASDGTNGSGIAATIGGSSASLDIASAYLELTTTPLDTSEPVRSVISNLLRLFRKPLKTVSIKLPPQFGSVSPGDTVYSTHPLLPFSGGTTGLEVWRQVPLYVLSVKEEFEPPGVTLECLDLRHVYVNWWSPFRTTIGVTDDYRGIAKLDRGGGWETDRDSVAYVQRPGDGAVQGVSADRAPVGKDGLLIEGGGDTNIVLNSSFSLGTSVFTYWTQLKFGSATIAPDTDFYLVDASGYRRSAKLTIAEGEYAYLQQTTASITANTLLHVHAWGRNDSGDDELAVLVVRNVDGWYWNDADQIWQASVYVNRIDQSAIWTHWISKLIDVGGSATTLTLWFGIIGYESDNVVHLGAMEVVTGAKSFSSRRSMMPTQHSSVTRTANVTWLNNDIDFRVWYVDKGWIRFTFTPNWSHSDLEDDDAKTLIYADHDFGGGQYSSIYYIRNDATTGKWIFEVNDNSSLYIPAPGDLPVAGRPVRIAARWTSEADDEFDLPGQALHIFVDSQDPTLYDDSLTEPTILDTSNVYLGTYPGAADDVYADGTFSRFELGSHPMSATDLKDRTGTITSFTVFPDQRDVVVSGSPAYEPIPRTRIATVVTLDLLAGGTAISQNIPTIFNPTPSGGMIASGVGTTAFVSA